MLPLDDNDNPINIDPGASPEGRRVTLDSAASSLTIVQGGNSATIRVEGSAEIVAPSATGSFHIADITLRQAVSSEKFDGHVISAGSIASVAVASGSIGMGGLFTLSPSTIAFDGTASIDGVRHDLTFSSGAAPSGSYNATTGEWSLEVTITDSGFVFTLQLKGTTATVRPTASINSLPAAAENEIECTSAAGASFTASGSSTNSSFTYWSLSDAAGLLYNSAPTATFSLPLRSPTAAPEILSFVGVSSPYAAHDARHIRITDRTPPSILQTKLSPVCKWGYSIGESNPQDPQLCAPVTGEFAEACGVPVVEVLSIETIDYPSDVVVRTENFGNGAPACVRPHPNYLDNNITMADYRVRYRVRDQWNNYSPVRTWRGYFTQSSPTATCSHTALPITLMDAH